MRFVDRCDGGRQLAQKLLKYKDNAQIVVIGVARGGIVVAAEVARILHVPLDVVTPRKIGAPRNPELAIGVVSEHGTVILDQNLIRILGVPKEYIDLEVARERKESYRRALLYRGGAPLTNLSGKIVVLVDDGVATGATMRAAITDITVHKPRYIVVAAPVIAADTAASLAQTASNIVSVYKASNLESIGQWYDHFDQVHDDEVIRTMRLHRHVLTPRSQ